MPFKTYTPSKADQARAIAAQLKAEGKPVRPKTVLDILAKRGITMDPGQCSVITGEFRNRRKRTRTRRSPAKVLTGKRTLVNNNGQAVSKDYSHLEQAARFAQSCGGVIQAQKALAQLSAIVDPFIKS